MMTYNDHDLDDLGKPGAKSTKTKRTTAPKEGSLASMAAKAGMSSSAFAKANIHATGQVGALARLYYTLQGNHGAGKTNMAKPGDGRSATTPFYQIG